MRRLAPAYMLVVLLGIYQRGTDAVGSLEVSSGGVNVADGSLQVCPGTTVSLTCSHDDVELTRWDIGVPIECTAVVAHTTNPGDATCASFTVNMVSDSSQPTRVSTLVLPLEQSLNGAVVICYAGGATTDSQVGNLTLQFISPPSTPTVVSTEYSAVDGSTGQVTLVVSSSGAFETGVSFYGRVIGDGSVEVAGDRLTVTGLSYTESHTVSVVITSAVCPGMLNGSSIDVPVTFNTKTPELTQPTGFVDCSNPSLPISGSWIAMEGVRSSFDPAVQLTPPPIGTPTITFTSSPRNLSGNAVFVPDSSYQLTDTVENDVYTFTVTVTNAAGSSSEVSERVTVTPFVIDESTLGTMNCLTFSLGQTCASEQSGNFAILLQQASGVCQNVRPSDLNASSVQLMSQSTCAPVVSSTNLCYRANLMYNGMIIDTQTNLDFAGCPVSVLKSFLADGVSHQLDGEVTDGNVTHLTTATLSCNSTVYALSNSSQITCIDGTWGSDGLRSCVIAVWLSVVIILICIILALIWSIGIVCGLLTAGYFTSGLAEKKCWAILVVILLLLIGVGFGVLIIYCYKRDSDRKSKPRDAEKLTQSTSSPPPPADSLYADPKSIEHQAAPSTEDQYAMVDRNVKKNTKPNPTSPGALYQDPNTIEHETAASRDTYAVVDKPKRSSKTKGGPDVVPLASEGLTYAEIDLSSKCPKPGSGRQAAQQPGEHSVEYSSVEHGSFNERTSN